MFNYTYFNILCRARPPALMISPALNLYPSEGIDKQNVFLRNTLKPLHMRVARGSWLKGSVPLSIPRSLGTGKNPQQVWINHTPVGAQLAGRTKPQQLLSQQTELHTARPFTSIEWSLLTAPSASNHKQSLSDWILTHFKTQPLDWKSIGCPSND